MTRADVLVVGGGIAGVSVAYELAATHRVVLAESEGQLAYHTTGRSAALYFENYGHAAIRPLSKASRRFLEHPPPELCDVPLLTPRGGLTVARREQTALLDEAEEEGRAAGTDVRRLDPDGCVELVPALRRELLGGGLWEPGAADIDVAALHQTYVRGIRSRGGEVRRKAPVSALRPLADGWEAQVGDDELTVGYVVDAAGAWGDEVAVAAGVDPVGLQPYRRTAFMVPGREEWKSWPMCIGVAHDWYFKPDGIQLLCSPADETPSPPCDARPEDLDVAIAIERINAITSLGIRSVRSAWAGLRTFAPDRAMVIGPDPGNPRFVWLVGQGGTGIQTAPAAARLAAALLRGDDLDPDLVDAGVDPDALSPARLTKR